MSQGTVKAPEVAPTLEEWEPITVGDVVVFVDPKGYRHDALVTAIHGDQTRVGINTRFQQTMEWYDTQPDRERPTYTADDLAASWKVPSVNLVLVSLDDSKTDSFGRQIERPTSVPHGSTQTATGYYWLKK